MCKNNIKLFCNDLHKSVDSVIKTAYTILAQCKWAKNGGDVMGKQCELSNLKALLRFRNISYRELSQAIGLSVGALCDKLNGKKGRTFTIFEIVKVVNYLRLESNEIVKYFFAEILA